MKEIRIIRFMVLLFWTFFWGLSVVDKIIADVQTFWVGKDFFALFIKFFASLGLKQPIFATAALAAVSALEVINFVLFSMASIQFFKGNQEATEKWFFRAVLSSLLLFSLFSIGDQVFGDRFQLLEHGLFWIVLLASWLVFKYMKENAQHTVFSRNSKGILVALGIGTVLTIITSISIFNFSAETISDLEAPVEATEVLDGVYKFDFPFLADKLVWETTVNTFKENHPELNVTYIYTGPSELNTKKKTHMLLYVFTERR